MWYTLQNAPNIDNLSSDAKEQCFITQLSTTGTYNRNRVTHKTFKVHGKKGIP